MTERTDVHKQVEHYYRNIRGYHQCVEDQCHESYVVPPELLLQYINKSGLTVDIAGGSGINGQILGLDASKYLCVDFSLHGLSIATGKGRAMCVQADVARLPIRNNAAESVLCSWSLEHMLDPEHAFDEMIRIVKPGGRIVLWGPNWDNILRKDFPQFAHKDKRYISRVRRKIFLQMIKNEFLAFRYSPYINPDVAAFADPNRFISGDTDAIHCVLCQETVKLLKQKGMSIVHVADFSEMSKHLHNDGMIRTVRQVLAPLLPLLRRIPLVRWFVIRFPIVVEKPV